MAEENNDQQQWEKVQAAIKAETLRVLDEHKAQEAAQQARQQQDNRGQQKVENDQLKEVLDPYFKPGLDQANLNAADARDAVSFYRNNPGLTREQEQQVEEMFQKMKEVGRPTSRQDLYRTILGKEYTDDPESFIEKRNKAKQEQLDRAREAADFGSSGYSIQKPSNAKELEGKFQNFGSLTSAEQEELLDGVTF